MTTEQTAQQLELAAQIIRTGHPWEYNYIKDFWQKSSGISVLLAISEGWPIRLDLATPPDGRPLHNPDNLTAEQVGAGYRLTVSDDIAINKEYWFKTERRWLSSSFNDKTVTCRLPLSVPWPEPQPDPYAELKKAHAEGKVIQFWDLLSNKWEDCPNPVWTFDVSNYRIKPEEPAFQLPPPPPGMQWHREDEWEEGDLPSGYRPLILDEISPPTDEIKRHYGWTALTFPGDCPELPAKEHTDHCRTRRPLTFTHAGKQWTWHRPGDPMPCDGESKVEVILKDVDKIPSFTKRGDVWIWHDCGSDSIIGWRYADEKKTVPLGPDDVPPGSVLSLKPPRWFIISGVNDNGLYILDDEPLVENLWRWDYLMEKAQINRSIPLTGRWNPDSWEPCHKLIPENG